MTTTQAVLLACAIVILTNMARLPFDMDKRWKSLLADGMIGLGAVIIAAIADQILNAGLTP
jgi:hypothetical protein